jgi:hypothetical protein
MLIPHQSAADLYISRLGREFSPAAVMEIVAAAEDTALRSGSPNLTQAHLAVAAATYLSTHRPHPTQ